VVEIKNIKKDGKILAIFFKIDSPKKSLEFLTPDDFPFQAGIHKRKSGEYVKAHEHIPFKNIKRLVVQEFFYIKSGKIQI